jgi:hypothetical protein
LWTLLKHFFGNTGHRSQGASQAWRPRYRLEWDVLEDRTLFSASTLDITGSTLTFTVGAGINASISGSAASATFSVGGSNAINTTGNASFNSYFGGLGSVTGSLISSIMITQLVINGGGAGATFTFNAVSGTLPALTVSSSIATTVIAVSSLTTNGSQTYNSPVSLASSTTLSGTTGTFTSSLAGNGNNLTLNFSGGANFNPANFTGLNNFTNAGATTINTSGVVTTGTQSYTSLFVTSNSTLTAGTVAVNGNLTLGSSATTATNTLTVSNNLNLTGVLSVALASNSQFGRILNQSGVVNLSNASLSLNFAGFVPAVGNRFVIAAVSGQFTNVVPGPYMQSQVTFNVTYQGGPSGNSFVLTVVQSAAGVNYVVAAAGPGGGPLVNVYTASNGNLVTSFYAFAPTFTGGVRVAVADVNGDGTPDIICGAGPGGGPEVAVFDGKTFQRIMDFMALPPGFTGGVFVAAGDVNNDGFADIVTAADTGGGPQVTITSGKDGSMLASFYATAASFTGGIRVACADLNSDGFADVIAAAGPGGGPQVTIFNGKTLSLLTAFYALPPTFTGGMYVAVGTINGVADIIVGAEKGGGPEVNVINGQTQQSTGAFFALPPQFTGGVRVAFSSSFEGHAAIVTVAGPGGGPQLSIFDASTRTALDNFYAFAPTFGGGVFVGGT